MAGRRLGRHNSTTEAGLTTRQANSLSDYRQLLSFQKV